MRSAYKIKGVYVLADEAGHSARHWQVVEERSFVDGYSIANVLVCDCTVGHDNKVRLNAVSSLITCETLNDSVKREELLYCKTIQLPDA